MNADVSKMRRWTKKEVWSSALLFLLNLLILLIIVAALLVGGNLGNLKQTLEANKANYIYIAFCLVLLAVITYFYFFFEDRSVLSEGKNIILLFMILDVSLVVCVLMGKWLNIYARPVALCALLTFLLLGRRSAMFMNIISALTLFIVDNFSSSAPSPQSIYSALMIAFTAGMVAIFAANRLRTRLRVVLVGILIALPMDFMIFLLEISSLAMQGTSVSQAGAARNIWMNLGYGFAGGISSAILFLLLLPVFECLFSVLTVFRLRELTSLDSPLLKKLKDEAAYRVIKKEYWQLFDVIEKIDKLLNSRLTVTVAIDGNSGAGKSFFAQALKDYYGCQVLHTDDFFLPPSLKSKERLDEAGGNVHYERLRETMIKMKDAGGYEYDRYDCGTGEFKKVVIPACRLNIVEGCYSLHRSVKDMYDLAVIVKVNKAVQTKRILNRDGAEKLKRYVNEWIPLEDKYFSALDTTGVETMTIDTSKEE